MLMDRFRKRPVEVDARQFVYADRGELAEWIGGGKFMVSQMLRLSDFQRFWQLTFWCEKSQAAVQIEEGDWVIKEPDGDGFYPCTAAEFERGYERIV